MKIFLFSTGALCLKANLKKNPLLLYKWVTQWYPLHASLGIPAVLFWQELRVLVNPGTISLSELFKQFLLSHLDNVYKSTSTLFILFFLNTFLFTWQIVNRYNIALLWSQKRRHQTSVEFWSYYSNNYRQERLCVCVGLWVLLLPQAIPIKTN